MALQVGELFASFTVDTKGAERALEAIEKRAAAWGTGLIGPRMEELGLEAVTALAKTLNAETGQGVSAGLMAGLTRGIDAGSASLISALRNAAGVGRSAAEGILSAGAGQRIGRDFGAGIADGIGQMAERVSRAAASLLREAMPGGSSRSRSDGGSPETGKNVGTETAALASAVRQALNGVSVNMDGQKVGDLVTDRVSGNIAAESAMRG